ncbi:MAG: hypothetical protein J7L51_02915 [Desulfurococcales archaeon]|nr:hypothetical protein [Desulfurococcales archaeon]
MRRLPIVLEELCDYRGPSHVEVSEEEYRELCRRYGIHGIDWYFVAPNRIKYFDGERWGYAHH